MNKENKSVSAMRNMSRSTPPNLYYSWYEYRIFIPKSRLVHTRYDEQDNQLDHEESSVLINLSTI